VRKQERLEAPAGEGEILRAIAGIRPKKLPLTPTPLPLAILSLQGTSPRRRGGGRGADTA
jgi:hypothetical protein